MGTIILIVIAIVVFILLWVAIDLLTGLIPTTNPPNPKLASTLNIILKLLLILFAVVWLVQTFLGGIPGLK